MDYTTLITRYADGTYRVRIKRKMHFFPYTLKDIFLTKDRAQGFAKRLANKNKGNYIGEHDSVYGIKLFTGFKTNQKR